MADARVLLGRPVATTLNNATLERSQAFLAKHKRRPRLAVVTVDDPAGVSYTKTIRRTSKKVGVDFDELPLDAKAGVATLLKILTGLNDDRNVDGILVQTPLPKKITVDDVGKALDPSKDVDGITPYQSGLLFRGATNALVPSTARAAIEILDFHNLDLKGAEIVIVGRSLVVGKPLGILMLGRHATVTWCHSRTLSLPAICKRADVLVAAMGRPRFINTRFIRPGATVIDVGINVDKDGRLCGDVDTSGIHSIAAAYTPVPGGVGPVTSACLYANLVDAAVARIQVSTQM